MECNGKVLTEFDVGAGVCDCAQATNKIIAKKHAKMIFMVMKFIPLKRDATESNKLKLNYCPLKLAGTVRASQIKLTQLKKKNRGNSRGDGNECLGSLEEWAIIWLVDIGRG